MLNSLDLTDKKVLLRADLNVPLNTDDPNNIKITNTLRIESIIPTIKLLLSKQVKQIIIISHLGRPDLKKINNLNNTVYKKKYSLKIISEKLSELLKTKIIFCEDYIDGINILDKNIAVSNIILCENIRFYPEEEQNNPKFSEKLAKLADIFVMDAFGTAHRKHASTYGVTKYIKLSVAGLLVEKELSVINKILNNITRPLLAIVAGSKISTKLSLLNNILDKVDFLILGGGIANTFLKAQGIDVKESLFENDSLGEAKEILYKARQLNKKIVLPIDYVWLNDQKLDQHKIVDIGPKSCEIYKKYVIQAKTILWNGPVGIFEDDRFAHGTKVLGKMIANNTKAYSIVGGGDTVAAVDKFNLSDKMSYISTGGGAFLEMLEGNILPGVEQLKK